MTYSLDNKIIVTKEFLEMLETQGWHEIENLQTQLANIEVNNQSTEVIQLLKNLLTSYYVFVGGIENLNYNNEKISAVDKIDVLEQEAPTDILTDEVSKLSSTILSKQEIEPFEYFVDFDEPYGEALSDEDLYGNK